MALQERKVEIVIDKKGDFVLTALEGFSGENCLSKTKNLELALGGEAVDGGKTNAYYDGGDDPVSISIDGLN